MRWMWTWVAAAVLCGCHFDPSLNLGGDCWIQDEQTLAWDEETPFGPTANELLEPRSGNAEVAWTTGPDDFTASVAWTYTPVGEPQFVEQTEAGANAQICAQWLDMPVEVELELDGEATLTFPATVSFQEREGRTTLTVRELDLPVTLRDRLDPTAEFDTYRLLFLESEEGGELAIAAVVGSGDRSLLRGIW